MVRLKFSLLRSKPVFSALDCYNGFGALEESDRHLQDLAKSFRASS